MGPGAPEALTNQSHNIPIPDDDFDLAEEPSFHSISNSAIPEKSEDVLKDDKDPGQVEQVQRKENTTQTDGPNPDVLLQRLAEVESMLADVIQSQTNTEDETKDNSKRLGILEAEVSKWNGFYENEDQQLHATGQCPSKQEPRDDLDPAVGEALENELLGDQGARHGEPLVEKQISPENLQAPSHLKGGQVNLNQTQGTQCTDQNRVERHYIGERGSPIEAPPGFAPLPPIPSSAAHQHGHALGHGEIVTRSTTDGVNSRGFDDCFEFFSGPNRQTAEDGCKQNQQYGKDGQGEQYTPTGRPSSYADGTRENPIHAATQPTQSNQIAATESLSMGELNMILKIMQQCVGEFPNIELGGMAERPDHLRRWRYAVSASLEP